MLPKCISLNHNSSPYLRARKIYFVSLSSSLAFFICFNIFDSRTFLGCCNLCIAVIDLEFEKNVIVTSLMMVEEYNIISLIVAR